MRPWRERKRGPREKPPCSRAGRAREAGCAGSGLRPAPRLLSARTCEDYEGKERVSAHTGSFYEVIANPSPEHRTPMILSVLKKLCLGGRRLDGGPSAASGHPGGLRFLSRAEDKDGVLGGRRGEEGGEEGGPAA